MTLATTCRLRIIYFVLVKPAILSCSCDSLLTSGTVGVPLVLIMIIGNGEMAGLADARDWGDICSIWNRGDGWAVSSCDLSTGHNLVSFFLLIIYKEE